MRIKIAVVAVLALLAIPALAVAGVKPPEDTTYTKTGTTTFATTKADKDSNDVAEKVDVSLGLYECGNNVPLDIKNRKINGKGKFKFDGRAKNFAGQKFKVKLKGEFKSAKKVKMKATIKDGNCKKTEKFVLKRQDG